jgi:hypothetical protein
MTSWWKFNQQKKEQGSSSSSSGGAWGGYYSRQLEESHANHLCLPYDRSHEPSIPEYAEWTSVHAMRHKDAGWDANEEQDSSGKGKGKVEGVARTSWGPWAENKSAHRGTIETDGPPRDDDALPQTWREDTRDGQGWNYVRNSHSWRVSREQPCNCGYDTAACGCGDKK